jgi:hypothetical protein
MVCQSLTDVGRNLIGSDVKSSNPPAIRIRGDIDPTRAPELSRLACRVGLRLRAYGAPRDPNDDEEDEGLEDDEEGDSDDDREPPIVREPDE